MFIRSLKIFLRISVKKGLQRYEKYVLNTDCKQGNCCSEGWKCWHTNWLHTLLQCCWAPLGLVSPLTRLTRSLWSLKQSSGWIDVTKQQAAEGLVLQKPSHRGNTRQKKIHLLFLQLYCFAKPRGRNLVLSNTNVPETQEKIVISESLLFWQARFSEQNNAGKSFPASVCLQLFLIKDRNCSWTFVNTLFLNSTTL